MARHRYLHELDVVKYNIQKTGSDIHVCSSEQRVLLRRRDDGFCQHRRLKVKTTFEMTSSVDLGTNQK